MTRQRVTRSAAPAPTHTLTFAALFAPSFVILLLLTLPPASAQPTLNRPSRTPSDAAGPQPAPAPSPVPPCPSATYLLHGPTPGAPCTAPPLLSSAPPNDPVIPGLSVGASMPGPPLNVQDIGCSTANRVTTFPDAAVAAGGSTSGCSHSALNTSTVKRTPGEEGLLLNLLLWRGGVWAAVRSHVWATVWTCLLAALLGWGLARRVRWVRMAHVFFLKTAQGSM